MSAHGPMPRSAWIFPALAVALFAVGHRPRTDVHADGRRIAFCGRAAGDPVRHRVRGRASRRGHRRADRRALWHAAPDALGHHHRGRADRDHHARRQAGAGAGARHRVCGGDDRVQRPRRSVHLHRRAALSRAGFSSLRRQPLSQRAVRAGDHHADHAELHTDGRRGRSIRRHNSALWTWSRSCSTACSFIPRRSGISDYFVKEGAGAGRRNLIPVEPDVGAQHRTAAASHCLLWRFWRRNFRSWSMS